MVGLYSFKKCFLNHFGKSVILMFYYQLPFFQSGRFPAKWIGLGRSRILQVYPVFLKFETHLKMYVRTDRESFHEILKCNWKARHVDKMESVLRHAWTQYACYAPVQLIFLEINHFTKTATGNIKYLPIPSTNC